MNLTKVSAVAEIVSSLAILVTLAYLAVEMRQNTTAIQATVRQAMLTDDRELLFQQVEHPVLFTGRSGDADLTDEELVQIASNLVATMRVRENQWLQFRSGVIDERTWVTYRSAIPAIFTTDWYRSWWRNRSARGEFDAEFVIMVNDLLNENPLDSPQSLRERLGFDPL
jgi:hypothetical protein